MIAGRDRADGWDPDPFRRCVADVQVRSVAAPPAAFVGRRRRGFVVAELVGSVAAARARSVVSDQAAAIAAENLRRIRRVHDAAVRSSATAADAA